MFEGGDGVGKSSVRERIAQWLPSRTNQTIVETGEPYNPDVRLLVERQLCPLAELLLFAGDRAEHYDKVVQPRLGEGCLVLCDRGFPSTYAYQGYGRGIDIRSLLYVNSIATKGLQPDLVFWLDAPAAVGLARTRGDRFEREALEFHERVRKGYMNYAATYPNVVRINAAEPLDVVTERVKDILKIMLAQWGK